ncbi:G-protein coupled receptor 78 [Trichosurus vulpecula]|uniref:G-protein coupled receptor 78 n=1 Tax=Trichosurus vulpecula TaxID=9337 RepID=UPI00186B3215|nr:G-protein coupled receptor 78 [Trichosurus vulpecula]
MDLAEALLALLLGLVLVVSLLSNLLVLLCFLSSSELRQQVPGLFLVNLSLCNLLLTLLNMPFTLLGLLWRQQPVGDCACQAAGFLETLLASNAMLSMAALSLDKWVAVVFPLSYASKVRGRDAALLLAYAWLHSLAFPLAALVCSWLGYSGTYASCTLHLRVEAERRRFAAFTVAFHVASFALSLVVLCFTYLKVLRVARFHCRRIDVITMQTLVLLVDIHPSVRQRCLNEQKRRRQRATKKISIFIGSFVLCFAPYVITRLVELLPFITINNYWGVISKCLTYSKAALDPFVYSLLRQQYKKAVINIVNRLLRRDLYPSSGYNSSLDTENDYCLHRPN